MKPTIALYEGHDTNLTVHDPNTDSFYIYEFERVSGIKHHNTKNRQKTPTSDNVLYLQRILNHLKEVHGIENDFDTLIFKPIWWDVSFINRSAINADKEILPVIDHHDAHAWCGYGQAPESFENSACITYDGWGDNTAFKYSCFKGIERHSVEPMKHNFSMVYTAMAHSLKILHGTMDLDLPGKLMGLSSYGEVNRTWTEIMKTAIKSDWWKEKGDDSWNDSENPLLIMRQQIHPCIQTNDYNIKLKNTKAFMLARSAQVAFEECIVETIKEEFLDKIEAHDNNLIISGGSALNVLANEAIKRAFPDVNIYIPPNCHDGGLSFGMLYEHLKTTKKYDVTQSGPRIFDYKYMDPMINLYGAKKVSINDIADLLKEQKIIGMVIGNMEVGPRALGNRSILCDASNPKMKDTLNCRVKFREWFRPFAPICRKEDAPKYFYSPNFDNMECMQFVADVLPEYQTKLFSVTHYDNTARLQVVTEESNAAIYDILTAFDGVLINTSLNVQGKPILNTFDEAFHVLQKTGLDHIVVEYENDYWLF
tara:strand:- start:388 stop:1998 length:1611 start_codon:yes stop_codon:yes gene_type:complete